MYRSTRYPRLKEHNLSGPSRFFSTLSKLIVAVLTCACMHVDDAQAQVDNNAGDKGRAEFPQLERITSIANPEVSPAGFLVLFSVTRHICLGVEEGREHLASLAPKGFTLAHGDMHSAGFKGNRTRAWWAVSVTGDGEKDDEAHHPYWYVNYDENGGPRECSLDWVVDASATDPEVRQHILHWLYIGAPQLFRSILMEPRFAGLYAPIRADLIQLLRPCPQDWCRITINPLVSRDRWHISVSLQLSGGAQKNGDQGSPQ